MFLGFYQVSGRDRLQDSRQPPLRRGRRRGVDIRGPHFLHFFTQYLLFRYLHILHIVGEFAGYQRNLHFWYVWPQTYTF